MPKSHVLGWSWHLGCAPRPNRYRKKNSKRPQIGFIDADTDAVTVIEMSSERAQIKILIAALGYLAQRAVLAWTCLGEHGKAEDGLRTGLGVSWTGDCWYGHHQPRTSTLVLIEHECLR